MALSITYRFWSSEDAAVWLGPHSDISGVLNSRYIKVEVNMASDEDDRLPTLEDMTIGYFKASATEANWIFHNVSEGEHFLTCPMCQERIGGVCVNIPAGEKDFINGCTAPHYRCDGNGNCTAPTKIVSGPCLTWTGVSSNCAAWCPSHGYISCVELWYYLWDAHCGTFERTYPCSGSWTAPDAGRSWRCRCVDHVYD